MSNDIKWFSNKILNSVFAFIMSLLIWYARNKLKKICTRLEKKLKSGCLQIWFLSNLRAPFYLRLCEYNWCNSWHLLRNVKDSVNGWLFSKHIGGCANFLVKQTEIVWNVIVHLPFNSSLINSTSTRVWVEFMQRLKNIFMTLKAKNSFFKLINMLHSVYGRFKTEFVVFPQKIDVPDLKPTGHLYVKRTITKATINYLLNKSKCVT